MRVVHVIPFVEDAAVVEAYDNAIKTPAPYDNVDQVGAEGIVRVVHVMPFVEDAAVVTPCAIATNVPLP